MYGVFLIETIALKIMLIIRPACSSLSISPTYERSVQETWCEPCVSTSLLVWEEAEYGVFLSYRVNSDKHYFKSFYEM